MTTYLSGTSRDERVAEVPRLVRLAQRHTAVLGVSAASSSRDVADDLDERAQTDADPIAAVLACRHELTRVGDSVVGIPDAVDAVGAHLDEIAGAVPLVQAAAADLPHALTCLIATIREEAYKLAVAIIVAAAILGAAIVLAVVLS